MPETQDGIIKYLISINGQNISKLQIIALAGIMIKMIIAYLKKINRLDNKEDLIN